MSYKRGLAVVVGCVIAALVSYAATYPRFHPVAPTEAAPGAQAKPAAGTEPSLAADLSALRPNSNPLAWSRLTDAQRVALAPFATQWDQFSDARKRKWLKIAARYPKLPPDEQKRLQARMTEWVRMTPDQRRLARENYQASKELPAQARQKAWKAYQQLPEEQKERLAATERKRRPTVVSAPPTGKTEVHDIDRLVNERERRATPSRPPGASAPAAASGAVVVTPPANAGIPAAGSFVPAIPIPVSPSEAPAAYKGS